MPGPVSAIINNKLTIFIHNPKLPPSWLQPITNFFLKINPCKFTNRSSFLSASIYSILPYRLKSTERAKTQKQTPFFFHALFPRENSEPKDRVEDRPAKTNPTGTVFRTPWARASGANGLLRILLIDLSISPCTIAPSPNVASSAFASIQFNTLLRI